MNYKLFRTFAPMRSFFTVLLLALLATQGHAADRLAEANRLYHEASWQLDSGRIDKAHEGLLQAADCYRQCRGQETKVSLCLYQLSISYFNLRDLSAMQNVLTQMRQLARTYPQNRFIQYDYYSVLSGYESIQQEQQPSDSLREEMMAHLRKSLYYQERMSPKEWSDKLLNPVLNYMNVATMYDMMYDPPMTDSTRLYVEKARAVNRLSWGQPIDHKDGEISIRDMQAWLYFYARQYREAEHEMLDVIALIDSIQPLKGNAILTERGQAYEFLAMLYESTGRPQQALQYQKLMNDNNLRRFSVEKNLALHKVEAKYEIEKREEAIRHLNTQNRILLLTLFVIGITALLAASLWLYRRRLREQRLYTEALQADAEQQAEHTSLTLLASQLGITGVNLEDAQTLMRKSVKPLTVVDQKYILCFLAGESVKRIAARFHVEPASVYTVRYRLKRKFATGEELPF